ncbi:DUF968 domain-containing protein [Winslowiella arboricola]|uniref:DUF968 domain-containing protein n=1 Tax=Winslowiella arboricola TaxID=2978220 RepID=UPI00225E2992|nr:DUF968 domain-containing protein [Winslowiella arboricola]MCU5775208.1 DUF968 domain-containing protein [Winslowiella arboricola]
MRALLNADVAPRTGIVLLRPGSDLLGIFTRGRVLVCPEPEFMKELPTGRISDSEQPLLDDAALVSFFTSKRVINAAGGLDQMEGSLDLLKPCDRLASDNYHSPHNTTLRTADGAVRLCYHHDNKYREMVLPTQLEDKARRNAAEWIITVVRRDLRLPEGHQLTLPELCWWASLKDVIDLISETPARRVLNIAPVVIPTGPQKEYDLRPEPEATGILQEAAKQILALKIDDESPESFMLRPKRKRWANDTYTRWVKAQPCACCGKQADDPHHIIGHGQGGMGTKAHDLFVLPLCRQHHDELHADMNSFEEKYGSQIELLFRFLDHSIAVGVIGTGKK